MIQLTDKQLEKVRQLIMNPPLNSKIAEAKEFGVDLTLLAENLRFTPQERIDKMQSAISFLEDVRQQSKLAKEESKNLGDILQSLVNYKVDFIIVGEVACYLHGWKHISPKLELLHSRSKENLRKLVDALLPFKPRPRGFHQDLPFILDEITLQSGTEFKFSTKIGDIDLLGEITGIGNFIEVEKISVPIEFYGYKIKILSLDGLIKTKRAAGRTKDLLVLPELEALREAIAESDEE